MSIGRQKWLGLNTEMRARRKDANHADVRDGLRAAGYSVLDLASYGVSVDCLVGWDRGAALVEIKDGSKPPSARALTEDEVKLRDNWQGHYIIALSLEDALEKLKALTSR